MTQTVLQIPHDLKPADGRFGSGPSGSAPSSWPGSPARAPR